MELSPYLSFNGDCEVAFKFYERCLGGKIVALMTYGGSPMEGQTPSEWRNKIMHARLNGRRQDPDGFRRSARPVRTNERHLGDARHRRPQRCRAHLPCLIRKRDGTNAYSEDLLGRPFWHARRSIRDSVDDQLRVSVTSSHPR